MPSPISRKDFIISIGKQLCEKVRDDHQKSSKKEIWILHVMLQEAYAIELAARIKPSGNAVNAINLAVVNILHKLQFVKNVMDDAKSLVVVDILQKL